MQRRNQKLIEESPAPNLEPGLRTKLLEDALRAAKAGRYRSAGTVEFLVSGGTHYFLEVNARLQVEHPVTEMVTGIDLVKAQLRLAGAAQGLPAQDQVTTHGHAIECRINAEDPRQNFLPFPGPITRWQEPAGAGIRVDGAGYAGGEVSSHFDSLLAKVIARGNDRAEAIARMDRALDEFVITGVRTTVPFHRFALRAAPFAEGQYHTGTVAEIGPPPPPGPDLTRAASIAALWARTLQRPAAKSVAGPRGRSVPPVALRSSFRAGRGGWFHEL